MNDPNEIKIVTRQETFNDFAIRELAQVRAKCYCRLQFKRCRKDECKSCPTYKEYINCSCCMSDYDNARLGDYVAFYYDRYSDNPTAWMNHKEYCRFCTKLVLTIGLCLLLVCFPIMLLGGCSVNPPKDTMIREVSSKVEISDDYLEFIDEVFEEIEKSTLYGNDLTGDGKFNCQDKSVLFKLTWDDMVCRELLNSKNKSPEDAMYTASLLCRTCELVRNYNPNTGMHHLFVMVYDPNIKKYVTIEPDITWRDTFIVSFVYGEQYDQKFNHYGETEEFMSKLNPNLRRMFGSALCLY